MICFISDTIAVSLFDAIRSGDLELVKNALGAGAAINERGLSGITPLIAAAKYNEVAIFEELLKRGAKIDAKTDFGDTALSYAIKIGNMAIIDALLPVVDTDDLQEIVTYNDQKLKAFDAIIDIAKLSFGSRNRYLYDFLTWYKEGAPMQRMLKKDLAHYLPLAFHAYFFPMEKFEVMLQSLPVNDLDIIFTKQILEPVISFGNQSKLMTLVQYLLDNDKYISAQKVMNRIKKLAKQHTKTDIKNLIEKKRFKNIPAKDVVFSFK